jgi:hypothetical protein
VKKLTKLIVIASVASFGCTQVGAWAGEFPPQDELAQAVYQAHRSHKEPEQDMLVSNTVSEKLGYPEARAKALAEGKPLVVWAGTGDVVCPACMAQLAECVHHLTPTFPGVAGNTIVVAVPDGQGGLDRVADITQWTTGSPDFGHVPSVRRALRNWRERRAVVRGGWSVDAPQAAPAAMFPIMTAPLRAVAAPVVRAAPLMRFGGRLRGAGGSS